MSGVGVCTVITKSYLALARVLADSLRRHHPELPLTVVVVDRPDGCFDPGREPFEVVGLEDLGLADLDRRRFAFSKQQLVVSTKTPALRAMLERGHDTALFIDADMLVCDRLDPLLEAAGDVVLTPHLLEPADGSARELNILVSGVFNGGVVRVGRTDAGRAFLEDWDARLSTHCRWDPAGGIHWDQRWLDLVAARHPVEVLRDPAINVAYWALPERSELRPRLFHFSGFEPWHSERPTKYAATERTPLFDRYAELLREAGIDETIRVPDAYARVDNGVPVPAVARELYDGRPGDPFATGPGSFYEWLNSPVDAGEPVVTRLWHALWASRSDLREGFPDPLGNDRGAFVAWTRRTETDHDVSVGLRAGPYS